MTRDIPWQERAAEIDERRRLANVQGGEEAIRKQCAKGKLTIRERILGVLDAESFNEVGPIAGASQRDENGKLIFTPANFVLGIGRINGRHCVVGGEDFTMGAGSPNPAGLRKSIFTEDLALHYRLPLVRLHEGSGASITGSGGKNAHTLREPVYLTDAFIRIVNGHPNSKIDELLRWPIAVTTSKPWPENDAYARPRRGRSISWAGVRSLRAHAYGLSVSGR
ncbi:transposase domain-containing protein [Bradyrhizobium sp. USDA 4454]